MAIHSMALDCGWTVAAIVDDDGHLNLYITTTDGTRITEIETGQGDGDAGDQLAKRFTTAGIEERYIDETETPCET